MHKLSRAMKIPGQQEAFFTIERIKYSKIEKKDSKMPNLWCKEYMVKLKFPPATAVLYE